MPGKEINTSRAVEDALSHGMTVIPRLRRNKLFIFCKEKKLFVPYIHRQPPTLPRMADPASVSSQPNLMNMLSIGSCADYHSLEPDSWGIPSIPKHSLLDRKNCLEDGGLDLIVVPGVAFDEGFGRLGHGKGYYDYFLARYKLVVDKDETKGGMRMPILGETGTQIMFKERY